jgi:hypothetical protein
MTQIPDKIQSGLLDTFFLDSEQITRILYNIVLREKLVSCALQLQIQFYNHGFIIDNKKYTPEQELAIRDTVEKDALKAACMDQDYWTNVEKRLQECMPRFQKLAQDSKFVQLIATQNVAEISKIIESYIYKDMPTIEKVENNEGVQLKTCECDGCTKVLNASQNWKTWKPFDKSSSALKSLLDELD